MIRDAQGVEWELYDDSAFGIELAIDWGYEPQPGGGGLFFVSIGDLRRLWPAPDAWWELEDARLEELCRRAKSLLS